MFVCFKRHSTVCKCILLLTWNYYFRLYSSIDTSSLFSSQNIDCYKWNLRILFLWGSGLMNWMIRQITQLEVSMNCVERLVDYHKYDSEKAAIIPQNRPPSSWPQDGSITVTNLWLRYRPDLDPVLKGLTFAINGREKVGVCGRTGKNEIA